MTGQRDNRSRLLSIPLLLLAFSLDSSRATAAGPADRLAAVDPIPSLLRQLDDGQADLSAEAARKLASLGPEAVIQALPELKRLTQNSIYAHTRVLAAELAVGHSPDLDIDSIKLTAVMLRRRAPVPMADILAQINRDLGGDHQTREAQQNAAIDSAEIPPNWDHEILKWSADVASNYPGVRFLAVQSLAASKSHDSAGKAIRPLSAALDSDDNPFRIEVAEALGNYGRAAAIAAPALSRMADNANPNVRFAAVRALLRIDAPIEIVASALIASIRQDDECCADSLAARVGRDPAPKLLLQLTEIARSDADPRVRALAAEAEDTFERLQSR